jgi:pyrroline-5-carboxylate reductase
LCICARCSAEKSRPAGHVSRRGSQGGARLNSSRIRSGAERVSASARRVDIMGGRGLERRFSVESLALGGKRDRARRRGYREAWLWGADTRSRACAGGDAFASAVRQAEARSAAERMDVSTLDIQTRRDIGGDLGIVGVGAMAEAIVTGLCQGAENPPFIYLSPRSAARASRLAARYPSVHVVGGNQTVIERADVVLLCLRPQDAPAALCDIAFRAQQAVISVMAGVPIGALRPLVAPAEVLVRAIPLPAAARRAGLTAIHPGTRSLAPSSTRSAASSPSTTGGRSTRCLRLPRRSPLTSPISTRSADGSPTAVSPTPTQRGTSRQSSEPCPGRCSAHRRSTSGRWLTRYATAGGINEQFLTALRRAGTFDIVDRALDDVADRLEGE